MRLDVPVAREMARIIDSPARARRWQRAAPGWGKLNCHIIGHRLYMAVSLAYAHAARKCGERDGFRVSRLAVGLLKSLTGQYRKAIDRVHERMQRAGVILNRWQPGRESVSGSMRGPSGYAYAITELSAPHVRELRARFGLDRWGRLIPKPKAKRKRPAEREREQRAAERHQQRQDARQRIPRSERTATGGGGADRGDTPAAVPPSLAQFQAMMPEWVPRTAAPPS